ncbi:1-deoxy-D-xylulose-5-phosphate reductoisomerase [Chloroflexota bacterium]
MGNSIKRLAVLGSTGSVGQQALDVIRSLPGLFKVVALTAGDNVSLLREQIHEFQPMFFCCRNPEPYFSGCKSKLLAMEEIAGHPQVDAVVIATPSKFGLDSVLTAVKSGKDIALANKECLVMAGDIITNEARLNSARILPVDSEHSAIWQCLNGEPQPPTRIILTASGGPFRNYSPKQLKQVTSKEALKHPTWKMGKKVTIDSATLMNKGLEIIEAHRLFGVPYENIEVLIHPQSIVHSMVEFADGSIKAQLGCPDMRLPIQYALTYPERLPNSQITRLDWQNISNLTFDQPDYDTFPCLRLAINAGKEGGTYPAVLSAADDIAVDLFLSDHIRLTDIAVLVKQVISEHQNIRQPKLEDILAADTWARRKTTELAVGIK